MSIVQRGATGTHHIVVPAVLGTGIGDGNAVNKALIQMPSSALLKTTAQGAKSPHDY